MSIGKLFDKRMNLTTLLILVSAVILIGVLVINRLDADIAVLKEEQADLHEEEIEKKQERSELTNELEIAGTDDYIADKARTIYGYLYQDEIRFTITNPEVLWGDGDISEAQASEVGS